MKCLYYQKKTKFCNHSSYSKKSRIQNDDFYLNIELIKRATKLKFLIIYYEKIILIIS